jgi:hypothetical protein
VPFCRTNDCDGRLLRDGSRGVKLDEASQLSLVENRGRSLPPPNRATRTNFSHVTQERRLWRVAVMAFGGRVARLPRSYASSSPVAFLDDSIFSSPLLPRMLTKRLRCSAVSRHLHDL